MRHLWKRLGGAVLALALISVLFLGPAQAVGEVPVIRVAYPIQAGITDKDENGAYTGYAFEFLEEVAQYTGWRYEFVEVPGDISEQLTTLMEMLSAGEVDLMGSMLYSESMAQQYDYTSYHYGVVETVLQMPIGMRDDFVVNSQVWQELRVAALNPEGQYARDLDDYASINRFQITYVDCEDEEDQIAAVRGGRADALLNTSMNHIPGVRTVASFASKPVYFVARKGWDTKLLDQFNQAIRSVTQTDPTYTAQLQEKYFSATGDTGALELTASERAYLDGLDPLRVGVLRNWPPYQWVDETGESRGIAIDILREIADLTGIELEFVTVESGSLFELTSTGQVDLVAGVPYSYDLAASYGFSLLRPFVTSGYSTVTTDGTGLGQGRRVALTSDSPYLGATEGEETVYSTSAQCIQAVSEGDADCAIVDSYTAQYYRNQPGYSRLRMVPNTGENRQVTLGLIAPRDPRLISILNRAILSLGDETVQSTITQNLTIAQAVTMKQFVEENPFAVVVAVVVLAGVAIVMILLIQRQRSRANRRLALEMEKHRQIYALLNDVFFEYDYYLGQLTFAYPEGDVRPLRDLLAYDEADPNAAEKRTRREFIQQLRAQRDGVDEIQLKCVDGREHWLRLAMETVRDGERPVYSIGKINLIDDERREKDSLLALAQRDSLTQVYNTSTIRELVMEAIPLGGGAMVILDVDSFKGINDTLGHLEGDQVLVEITRRMRQSVREGDLLGRPGGDEFLIFLPGINDRDILCRRCQLLADRIRDMKCSNGKSVTVSMGAALSGPGESYDSLYQRADRALYQAKAAGRDRFIVAETE